MTINKTLAAALLALSAAAAAPSAANADVNVSIGLGGGYYGGGFYPGPVYGGGWAPPTGPSKISCKKGRKLVKWSGYKFVHTVECNGKLYTYKGRKFGKKYRIKVNAYNGNIVHVKKI